MTTRSFLALAGLTVLAVIAAGVVSTTSTGGGAIAARGEALLPGLVDKANSIAEITVETEDSTTTIRRDDGRFVDASGYPVRPEAVRDLVASLSVLTIEERKTADPNRYHELGLAEPSAEDGAGERVLLKDGSGNAIAEVVAGEADHTVGGTRGGQYVRAAGDAASYLVRGSVSLPLGRSGWFDVKLFEAGADAIAKASIRDGETAVVTLARQADTLGLVDPPAGRSADESKIDRLARLFQPLEFSDVRPADGAATPSGRSIALETTDGLRVTVIALGAGEQSGDWVRVTAVATTEAAQSTAEEVSAKTGAFDFRLSAGDRELLDWTMDDVTKAAES
jgi:Domain of unknown function (DUF4340)